MRLRIPRAPAQRKAKKPSVSNILKRLKNGYASKQRQSSEYGPLPPRGYDAGIGMGLSAAPARPVPVVQEQGMPRERLGLRTV